MKSKATNGLNRTATGLVGRRCEPWIRQPLVREYMEISASSCYQLFNGEFLGRPWCYQLDMYNPTHLDMFVLALCSEGPYS